MIFDYLTSLPLETWGFLGTGGATAWVLILKGVEYVKNQSRQNMEYAREQATKNMERVASVIAKTVHSTVNDSLEARHHVRTAQIDLAKGLLKDYGSAVNRTARDAVFGFVCKPTCGTIDLLTSLYSDAVMNTFLTDVLEYFIREVISKNGWREKSTEQIEDQIDKERKRAFAIFTGSMRRRFRHEQIQIRVDWIESNMDVLFMRQLVSNIVYGCRDLALEAYKVQDLKAVELPDKILKDLTS